MQNDRVSRSGNDPGREPFITIDDLVQKAHELFDGLTRLSDYKYPLDIRRGIGKEVKKRMNDNKPSKQVKGAGRTYFLDVEKTREDKSYLRITESRKGDGDTWERSRIHVFPEDAEGFVQAIAEMAARLG